MTNEPFNSGSIRTHHPCCSMLQSGVCGGDLKTSTTAGHARMTILSPVEFYSTMGPGLRSPVLLGSPFHIIQFADPAPMERPSSTPQRFHHAAVPGDHQHDN
ncbi:unnamed protein product [Pleuronectes platessa]|uniref:Uncharacterized protein n=1 Tax=Pleuronectes platessa TaxID=8262 RepID=A0A9N7TJV0_PLEPL|nr:unnamed protein product [Pleuronectes platessa]